MKEEDDFLFDLVKRLDPHEYRFVEQFALCGRKRPEKVLDLLAAMNGLKRYDKRLLEGKFSNLNIVRFHLRQLILRALRAYRDGETVDSQIRGLILDYEILYEKGLYEEAFRSLGKAEELAREHQNVARILEVLHLQKHRLLELETRDLVDEMNKRIAVSQVALDAFRQQWDMVNQYHSLFADYRTEERADGLGGMAPVEDGLLDDPDVPFQTRLYGFLIAGFQARSRGDMALARKHHERLLDFWRQYPELTKDFKGMYKIILANYAVYLFPEENYEQVQAILAEIHSLKDGNFNEEAETFQNVANLRLLLQLNLKTKVGLDTLVADMEVGLERYSIKINAARQFSIWYNLMLIYLIHEDYRMAWQWIGKIVEHKRFQVRKEVQYITRLLELLIYYELEIWDTPESTVVAVYRYLSRKEELTEFKREVLGIFTKLSATGVNDRKKVFQKLFDDLRRHENGANVADALGMKVVTAWAGSKVLGKGILEVLQE